MGLAGAENITRERLLNLGHLVERSASMEATLRGAFCALVGSKYAAVVAGGQNTEWLVQQCQALVKAHRELTAESKKLIQDALQQCREANSHRNVLVHGLETGFTVPDGVMSTLRSRRNQHRPEVRKWSPDELRQAWVNCMNASSFLSISVQNAVGPEVIVLDDALAWEEARAQESPADT